MLDENIPLKQVTEEDLLLPKDPEVNVGDFVDIIIVVGIYDESNWFRLASCVPLSLHMMEQPIHKNKPVHRPDFMEFNKM